MILLKKFTFNRLSFFLMLLIAFPLTCAQELSEDWVQSFKIKQNIVSEQSNYQSITIFDNRSLGKVLMLDDIVQFSEKDEFIYHEMLVHVPLMTHKKPQSILIIGGGDGACAREALKHPYVDHISIVELDGRIVDLSRKYFPSLADGAFDDRRVQLVLDDGYNFLKKNTKKYDVVIVSASDPLGPSRSLFQRQFFKLCKDNLTEDGVLACQVGSPITQGDLLKKSHKNLVEVFEESCFYYSNAPSQLGGIKCYSINFVKTPKNIAKPPKLAEKFKAIESLVQYYNPEIHEASFAAPRYYGHVFAKSEED